MATAAQVAADLAGTASWVAHCVVGGVATLICIGLWTPTAAIIDRGLNKRDSTRDVLRKVTLIRGIRFADAHRAHIEILSDLSLSALHAKHDFSNFVGLHEAWKKTLDTSELNKRFYQDLANWYFWALRQTRFPKQATKDADGLDSLSLALDGGEDYELLFTVPRRLARRLPNAVRGVPVTIIGEITRERRVLLVDDAGRAKTLPAQGWDPFRNRM